MSEQSLQVVQVARHKPGAYLSGLWPTFRQGRITGMVKRRRKGQAMVY
ncbi:MAG TPA: hypothetical protein VFN35_29430 [Ktedonobacteraceae bacterium]|nr:hypothetical protein [Ktedonobacteraceae bacterium]